MLIYNGFDPAGSSVSEKLDGVRAEWTGERLLSRDGHELSAPDWFTAGLGCEPLVGELWAGRGAFETVLRVPECTCGSTDHLDELFRSVLEAGGEGVVIRTQDGTLYKHKLEADDDAEVVGYSPGKGRNSGLVGALLVRDRQGREFKLGSGLCDDVRRCPPPVGSIVSFTHQGRTRRGIPRFASFLRVRAETTLTF